MKRVGVALENIALDASGTAEKDLFGRSAFNRYYYAAFLQTREMLGQFKSGWKKTPHKGIPELLKTQVKRQVSSKLKKAVKKELVSEQERSRILTKLNRATSELSNLLAEAYDIRVIADYESETLLASDGRTLTLNEYKLATANGWANRASAYCKDIRCVWRDSGLA